MRRQIAPTADGMCCGRLAQLALVLLLAASSVLAQTPIDESLVEFEERVRAAFAEVETALVLKEERLDDLATSHARRSLADGRASASRPSRAPSMSDSFAISRFNYIPSISPIIARPPKMVRRARIPKITTTRHPMS